LNGKSNNAATSATDQAASSESGATCPTAGEKNETGCDDIRSFLCFAKKVTKNARQATPANTIHSNKQRPLRQQASAAAQPRLKAVRRGGLSLVPQVPACGDLAVCLYAPPSWPI